MFIDVDMTRFTPVANVIVIKSSVIFNVDSFCLAFMNDLFLKYTLDFLRYYKNRFL